MKNKPASLKPCVGCGKSPAARIAAARKTHKLRSGVEFGWCSCGRWTYYGKPTHERREHLRHLEQVA